MAASEGTTETLSCDEWRELIGQHVEERRIALGFYSYRQMGLKTAVSEGSIRMVETGQRMKDGRPLPPNPSRKVIDAIAATLHWERDWLDRLKAGEQPTSTRPDLTVVEDDSQVLYRITQQMRSIEAMLGQIDERLRLAGL